MGITLRGTSVSVGRDVGDVVLPWDDSLAEMHLQLLIRHDGTFLQDLDSVGGTWVVVQAGEVVPSGSVLAIGERVMRVVAAESGGEVTVADRGWPTAGVYVAA
jgi:pSer/pThr/pTyr-binding forkhead associated (FHA) protein